jgi:hypothetical protein
MKTKEQIQGVIESMLCIDDLAESEVPRLYWQIRALTWVIK